MAGKQISFIFNSSEMFTVLNSLYVDRTLRLQYVMNEYSIDADSILTVQLIFTPFKHEIFSDVKLTRNLDSYTQESIDINKKDLEFFPVSINTDLLGESLRYSHDKDNNSIILH